MEQPPAKRASTWSWRFGVSRSSCLVLGFVGSGRPNGLWRPARIFFADEAHFRADAELRGKWVLKGKPALVDSNSPRYGEKASYYSAVCLETGEVEWMELEGNSNSGTSVAFLTQLPDATEGKASRAAAGHLGQCAGPSWGGGAGVPQDA